MTRYTYGNPDSNRVLIQMVDDHDLSVIEDEVNYIRQEVGDDFYLLALKVEDWNHDLSPCSKSRAGTYAWQTWHRLRHGGYP